MIGERVLIRPLEPNDWSVLFDAASDPRIWALHPVKDRYTEPVFREFFNTALDSCGAFAFIDPTTKAVIGSSRYRGYDPGANEIEIGWTFLTWEYWGKGYNREVKKLMIDHAFTFVDTCIFVVGVTNHRSRRAMEKIGGLLRTQTIMSTLNGVQYLHVVYEINKSNYTL